MKSISKQVLNIRIIIYAANAEFSHKCKNFTKFETNCNNRPL